MNVESVTSISERPSTAVRPESRTGIGGLLFRAVVTLHTIAAFGQPVFAGVYLSGDIGGLDWHARSADIVFYLGLAQIVVGAVASARSRRAWPVAASVLIAAAETGQYMAGLNGMLWLHLPLGVALIAALAVLFVTVWARPLPNRSAADRVARADDPHRDGDRV